MSNQSASLTVVFRSNKSPLRRCLEPSVNGGKCNWEIHDPECDLCLHHYMEDNNIKYDGDPENLPSDVSGSFRLFAVLDVATDEYLKDAPGFVVWNDSQKAWMSWSKKGGWVISPNQDN